MRLRQRRRARCVPACGGDRAAAAGPSRGGLPPRRRRGVLWEVESRAEAPALPRGGERAGRATCVRGRACVCGGVRACARAHGRALRARHGGALARLRLPCLIASGERRGRVGSAVGGGHARRWRRAPLLRLGCSRCPPPPRRRDRGSEWLVTCPRSLGRHGNQVQRLENILNPYHAPSIVPALNCPLPRGHWAMPADALRLSPLGEC